MREARTVAGDRVVRAVTVIVVLWAWGRAWLLAGAGGALSATVVLTMAMAVFANGLLSVIAGEIVATEAWRRVLQQEASPRRRWRSGVALVLCGHGAALAWGMAVDLAGWSWVAGYFGWSAALVVAAEYVARQRHPARGGARGQAAE